MTFDDGEIRIYKITNGAASGKKPNPVLSGRPQEHCFSYGELGVTRYYTALKADQIIEDMISIPDWWWFDVNAHVAVKEDGSQFRIRMAQRTTDEEGLQITRLTLERIGDEYAVVP